MTLLAVAGLQRLASAPAHRIPLRHLIAQAHFTGPLLAPKEPESAQSTPYLFPGWSPPGAGLRRSQKSAGVRFYLTQKVPVTLELEPRAEKPTEIRLGQLGKLSAGPEWIRHRYDLHPQEGANQIRWTSDGPIEWRQFRLQVAHAQPEAVEPHPTDERICLAFGRSHELPLLLQPDSALVIEDVHPWIEPGAPSLQTPWRLQVRIQGDGLDQSWQLQKGQRIRLPGDKPTQVCLTLMATSETGLAPGQSGLFLRNPRLETETGAGAGAGGQTPTSEQSPNQVQSTGAAAPQPKTKPNIVIFLVDTLRADHARTPNFEALAKDGVRFRCAAQSSWTKASVASMMTSLLPYQHGAEDFPDRLAPSHDTLAKTLHQAGYATHAVVANPFLARQFGFAEGFDSYREMHDANAHALVRASERSLRADRPFFLYVHVLDPHLPYGTFTVEDMKRLREDYEAGRPDPDRVQRAQKLYAQEIAQTDEAFGKLVAALKAKNLYDNTVIALVSDHGEQFFEHGLCDHMNSLYRELIDVPLVIKFPHNRGAGAAPAELFQHIDVAPTLLQQAGLPPSAAMQGRAYPAEGSQRAVFYSLHVGERADEYGQGDAGTRRADMDGIRVGPWVLHHATKTIADLEPLQIFNLDSDPQQNDNLAFRRPEARAWLYTLLQSHRARGNTESPAAPQDVVRESLRSLQYMR